MKSKIFYSVFLFLPCLYALKPCTAQTLTVSPAGPVDSWINWQDLTVSPGGAVAYEWFRKMDCSTPVPTGMNQGPTLGAPFSSIWFCIATWSNGSTSTSNYVAVRELGYFIWNVNAEYSNASCAAVGNNLYVYPQTQYNCQGPFWDSYQWQFNGVNIPNATNYTYNATQQGYYSCIISNTIGSVSTDSLFVQIIPTSPAYITPSGPITFCNGSNVTLNANTGTWSHYYWKKDNVNIPGATNSFYTATSSGSYSFYAFNSSCENTSAPVVVTVHTLPSATITPVGPTTFCSGGSVVLNAVVAANRTYQWKKGANLISGATLYSYTATTGGNYRVIVTNTVTGCSKTTNSATTVTVNALPSATITPQGPTTFCAGGSVVLQANTGTGLTYKWKKGTNFISGATLSNYTATTGGNYRVQVTNSNGCSKVSGLVAVSVPCKEGESVNMEEGESVFDFTVYPNPNSGEFIIKFSTKPTSMMQLELTDEIGKVVKRFKTDDETVVIKEPNLTKGIYCLTARNNYEVVVKKINIVK